MQIEIIVELLIDSSLNGQKCSILYSHTLMLALYSHIPYIIILCIPYIIILPIPYIIILHLHYIISLHLSYILYSAFFYTLILYFIPSFYFYLIVYTTNSAFILHLLYANLVLTLRITINNDVKNAQINDIKQFSIFATSRPMLIINYYYSYSY